MSEITPRAAETAAGAVDEQALAALRWGWGEAYRIGWDATRGWWAHRRDNLGGDITADGADGLWNAIREDYDLKPVPRDCYGEHPVPREVAP
jgi:hypothetical protein